ncbi:unnamed protein product [Protopolystoma xenopodis]|uniref:Uncharacterized protein n=1 Tax=Protopolystoma xenopodis TaxID=117903 RepID=A0A448XDX6_9PLAT|nr:unnamed protein product [Protopolystoma xenopodis]
MKREMGAIETEQLHPPPACDCVPLHTRCKSQNQISPLFSLLFFGGTSRSPLLYPTAASSFRSTSYIPMRDRPVDP